MRKLLLFGLMFIGILIPAHSFSKTSLNTDSLRRLITQLETQPATYTRDTSLITVLNQLSWEYKYNKVDSAILLSQRALQLSTQRNWPKGLAGSNRNLGWYAYTRGDLEGALAYDNKALTINEKMCTSADSSEARYGKAGLSATLGNIGSVYYTKGDYAVALNYYTRSLTISEELLGRANRMNDTTEAKKLLSGIASKLGNIGSVYKDQGNYPRALDYYFKVLKISDQLRDKSITGTTLGNIGIIYKNQKNYSEALGYYNKALAIDEETGNKTGKARHLGNIGTIYLMQEDYDKARAYFLQSLQLNQELGLKAGISNMLSSLGILFHDRARKTGNLGDSSYAHALDYYNQALKMDLEIGDKNSIGIAYGNIGRWYFEQGKLGQAEEYLLKAVALSQEARNQEGLKEDNQNLSELYAKQGNWPKALAHYKLFIAARDSISNEENTRQQTQTEMQYQFDKQQAADSIRNAEQVKQEELKHEQEIHQQRLYTYGGALGFLLMLVVAGVSFRAYRQKQRTNRIITEQKNLVEEKQKEILDSIHYARRIQRSLLPNERYIARTMERLIRK